MAKINHYINEKMCYVKINDFCNIVFGGIYLCSWKHSGTALGANICSTIYLRDTIVDEAHNLFMSFIAFG